MERIRMHELKGHAGGTVTVAGFVDARRDHGKLIFIDLRDETGKLQVVFTPKAGDAYERAGELRAEWVVELKGLLKERPANMQNADEPNGAIELSAESLTILSRAETPPFSVTDDTSEVGEETRLAYRYIDLRSDRMQTNIRTRADFVRRARHVLDQNGFVEIETPLLTKSTPEGSRDFLVPSRHNPGTFYALPQSPQQYKQLLMASGFERYYQLARAVRDEDVRADRGYEHTQIDIEMAYVKKDDVMQTVEDMMIDIAEGLGKTITDKPFPRFTYAEAIKRFGAEKFDLRTKDEKKRGVLAYAWVTDFPFFEKSDASNDSGKNDGWTFTHNPFSMPSPESRADHLAGKNVKKIIAEQYDLVVNGFEAGGGSIRAHDPEVLRATYRIMGYTDEEIDRSVGHMLKAFSFGVPPHGGIALGVERNVMTLTGEAYLREVQAFPMTGRGRTAVMDAPSEVSDAQLQELGLQIRKKKVG